MQLSKSIKIFLIIIFAAIYFYFNFSEFIPFLFLAAVAPVFIFGFDTKRIYKINLSVIKILLITLTLIYLFLCAQSIYHYTNNAYLIDNNVIEFMRNQFILFIYYIGLGLISFPIYIFIQFAVGSTILRQFKKDLTNNEFIVSSILLGMAILSTYYFLISAFERINIYTIFLPSVLLFFYRRNLFRTLQHIDKYRNKVFSVNLNLYEIIFIVAFLVTICNLVVISLRSLPTGPDAYRSYLTIIKYIADTGSAPETGVRTIYTYLGELILLPIYKIGGIPLSTLFLNMFTIITGMLIWETTKYYRLSEKVRFMVVICTLFINSYVGFLLIQYKIDPILLPYSLSCFILFEKFLRSKNIAYANLCLLSSGIVILIKTTALYFISPVIVAVFIVTLFSKYKYPVLRTTILGITYLALIPLVWFTFSRFSLPIINWSGLGLSSSSFETPLPIDLNPECNTLLPLIEIRDSFGIDLNLIKLIPSVIKFHSFNLDYSMISPFGIARLGLFTFITPILSLLILKKIMWFKDYKVETQVGLVLLLSLIPYLMFSPGIIWYLLPVFVYLLSKIWAVIAQEFNIAKYIYIYLLAIFFGITVYSFDVYKSIGISFDRYANKDPVFSYLNEYKQVEEATHGASGNILYINSYYALNINYYNSQFFTKVIYYDFLPQEVSLLDTISKYQIEYIVVNTDDDFGIKCVKDWTDKSKAKISEIEKLDKLTKVSNTNIAPIEVWKVN